MTSKQNDLSKIHVGALTLDEIKKYFSKPASATASARVLEKDQSENSPELNDSFKVFLKEQRTKSKKKPANLVLPSDDVIIKIKLEECEANGSDLATSIDAIPESECQTTDFIEGLRSIAINNSIPSLYNDVRPSVNVTKTRPVYTDSPVVNVDSPKIFDSTLNKIENGLSAEQQTPRKETELAMKSQDFLSSTTIHSPLDMAKSAQQFNSPFLKTPSPQKFKSPRVSASKKSPDHVVSPVAMYIHKSPKTPICPIVSTDLPSSAPRRNLRDSNDASCVSSLPMRVCERSGTVIKIINYGPVSVLVQGKTKYHEDSETMEI